MRLSESRGMGYADTLVAQCESTSKTRVTLALADLECVEAARQGLQLVDLQALSGHALGQTTVATCATARPESFEKWRKKVHQRISLVTEHAEALGDWVDTLGG